MQVLITRAEPAASRTIAKLSRLGFSPCYLPLFELVDLGTELPVSDYDGFIFTSANAIEVLVSRGWANENPDSIAFCVGQTTAENAKKAGFTKVLVSSGGGAKLAERMRSEYTLSDMKLVFPTTPDRSFDMVGELQDAQIVEIAIYQARKIRPEPEKLADALKTCAGGAVLTYSSRSASHLEALTAKYGLSDLSKTLWHVTISKQSRSKLASENWRGILVSEMPHEDGMIEQLKSIADSC